ncbi:MAG: hypothetical protein LBB26_01290 [Puniceicoccales bacterium]|nr:hypothetical protein [Puniceicoccales bacterium]
MKIGSKTSQPIPVPSTGTENLGATYTTPTSARWQTVKTFFTDAVWFYAIRIVAWLTLLIPVVVFVVRCVTVKRRFEEMYRFLLFQKTTRQSAAVQPKQPPVPAPPLTPEPPPIVPAAKTEINLADFGEASCRTDYVYKGTSSTGEITFGAQIPGESHLGKEITVNGFSELVKAKEWVALKIWPEINDPQQFMVRFPPNVNGFFAEGLVNLQLLEVESPYHVQYMECYIKGNRGLQKLVLLGDFSNVQLCRLGTEGQGVSLTFGPTSDGIPFSTETISISECPAVDEVHAGKGVTSENLIQIAAACPNLKRLSLSAELQRDLPEAQLVLIKANLPPGCEVILPS